VSSAAIGELLALQDLDTAIDHLRHQRATLPERAELVALHAAVVTTTRARDEAAGRSGEIAARQEAAEAELAASEERLAAVRRRMGSGDAASARDVTALSSGIDHLRERVSHLEDDILGAMDERAPFDALVEGANSELAALEERRQGLLGAVAAGEARIDHELSEAEGRRDAARQSVAPDLLAIYDRLRPRLDGVAVARLVGSHCDGCHLTLPATELDRLRREPPDVVMYCEQCGRILVRQA
jgi:predicted  nucleic acid-binding Zn-ribbon protein